MSSNNFLEEWHYKKKTHIHPLHVTTGYVITRYLVVNSTSYCPEGNLVPVGVTGGMTDTDREFPTGTNVSFSCSANHVMFEKVRITDVYETE